MLLLQASTLHGIDLQDIEPEELERLGLEGQDLREMQAVVQDIGLCRVWGLGKQKYHNIR